MQDYACEGMARTVCCLSTCSDDIYMSGRPRQGIRVAWTHLPFIDSECGVVNDTEGHRGSAQVGITGLDAVREFCAL